MSTDTGDQRAPAADGTDPEWEATIAKAAQGFMEQCEAAGGIQNANILALLADAVSPITERSDPSRVAQAVHASLTLDEFLTLKMRLGDQLSLAEIAQRQGRPEEEIRSEIARSTARIRMYQPKRPLRDRE